MASRRTGAKRWLSSQETSDVCGGATLLVEPKNALYPGLLRRNEPGEVHVSSKLKCTSICVPCLNRAQLYLYWAWPLQSHDTRAGAAWRTRSSQEHNSVSWASCSANLSAAFTPPSSYGSREAAPEPRSENSPLSRTAVSSPYGASATRSTTRRIRTRRFFPNCARSSRRPLD